MHILLQLDFVCIKILDHTGHQPFVIVDTVAPTTSLLRETRFPIDFYGKLCNMFHIDKKK